MFRLAVIFECTGFDACPNYRRQCRIVVQFDEIRRRISQYLNRQLELAILMIEQGNCLPCSGGHGPAGIVGGLSSAQAAMSNDLIVSTTFLPC